MLKNNATLDYENPGTGLVSSSAAHSKLTFLQGEAY